MPTYTSDDELRRQLAHFRVGIDHETFDGIDRLAGVPLFSNATGPATKPVSLELLQEAAERIRKGRGWLDSGPALLEYCLSYNREYQGYWSEDEPDPAVQSKTEKELRRRVDELVAASELANKATLVASKEATRLKAELKQAKEIARLNYTEMERQADARCAAMNDAAQARQVAAELRKQVAELQCQVDASKSKRTPIKQWIREEFEEGAPSAVASVTGVGPRHVVKRHTAVIACQGDWE